MRVDAQTPALSANHAAPAQREAGAASGDTAAMPGASMAADR